MDVAQVQGLAVVDMAEARTLGTIAHVHLDPASRRVVGFGVLRRGAAAEPLPGALDPSGAAFDAAPAAAAFLPAEAVRSLGIDAVMIATASDVEDGAPAPGGDWVALDALEGVDVVDAQGEVIGQLASASFDPASFALTGIEVVQGLLRRRSHIPASLIADLGTERIVAEVAGRHSAKEQHRDDGNAPDKARDAAAESPEPREIGSSGRDDSRKTPSRKAPRPPRSERRGRGKSG